MRNSKFSAAPANVFNEVVLGAGMFVETFVPSTAVIGNVLFATDGGANFNATPSFIDYADGLDNVPPNTKELKDIDSWTVTIGGTGKTVNPAQIKRLLAGADVDDTDTTKITPRDYLTQADFEDFWWLGPVAKTADGTDATFLAIHIINALSTGGMQMQSANRDKGSFPFTFTGHYSMADLDQVPFEIYCKNPTT